MSLLFFKLVNEKLPGLKNITCSLTPSISIDPDCHKIIYTSWIKNSSTHLLDIIGLKRLEDVFGYGVWDEVCLIWEPLFHHLVRQIGVAVQKIGCLV